MNINIRSFMSRSFPSLPRLRPGRSSLVSPARRSFNVGVRDRAGEDFFKFQNNFILSLVLLSAVFCATKIYSVDLLITTSGTYQLDDDILSSGDATNGTIRIQSSYVTLDLNTCFIQQTTNTANCNGIQIDPGFSDIVIKNGTVSGFTNSGISVGSNCSKININNLIVENCNPSNFATGAIVVSSGCSQITLDTITTVSCTGDAIDFIGTSNFPIFDSVINNIQIVGCVTNLSFGFFCVNLTYCNKVVASNINITDNGSSGVSLTGINLSSSTNCILNNINISANQSGAFSGIYLLSTNACNFYNISILGNNSSSGQISGFNMGNGAGCNSNQFERCVILNNTVSFTGQPFYGFYLSTIAQGNIFRNCLISGNSSGSGGLCAGFRFFNNATNIINNSLIDCIVNYNTANGGGVCAGFYIDGSNQSTLLRCIGSYNSSVGSSCYGLFFGNSTGGAKNWTVQNCEFANNNGNNDSNSYGISQSNTTSNLFSGNIAFGNGPVSPLTSNQLSGLPIGSYLNPGGGGAGAPTTRMSSAMSPWTSIRVTS